MFRLLDLSSQSERFRYSQSSSWSNIWLARLEWSRQRLYRISLPLTSIESVQFYHKLETEQARLLFTLIPSANSSYRSLFPCFTPEALNAASRSNAIIFETADSSTGQWHKSGGDWTEGCQASLNSIWSLDINEADKGIRLLDQIGTNWIEEEQLSFDEKTFYYHNHISSTSIDPHARRSHGQSWLFSPVSKRPELMHIVTPLPSHSPSHSQSNLFDASQLYSRYFTDISPLDSLNHSYSPGTAQTMDTITECQPELNTLEWDFSTLQSISTFCYASSPTYVDQTSTINRNHQEDGDLTWSLDSSKKIKNTATLDWLTFLFFILMYVLVYDINILYNRMRGQMSGGQWCHLFRYLNINNHPSVLQCEMYLLLYPHGTLIQRSFEPFSTLSCKRIISGINEPMNPFQWASPNAKYGSVGTQRLSIFQIGAMIPLKEWGRP